VAAAWENAGVRILVVNSMYYRRGGDAGHFFDHVTELERRGHEVAVFCMEHPQNLPSVWSSYWAPHVEYRGDLTLRDRLHAAWRSIYSAETERRIRRLLEDFRPDVVHFHSVHHHLTLGVVSACSRVGVPIVWTLHDYHTVCPVATLLRGDSVCEQCSGGRFWHCLAGLCASGKLSRSLVDAAESYSTRLHGVLGRVDCYVAPSRFLGRKVLEMGLPARRMEVVPNPVLDVHSVSGTKRRADLIFVGRLAPEKGVDVLVRALSGYEGAFLRVVGDGPERRALQETAGRAGLHAQFAGWAAADAVRDLMASAALLCVPSVWYENCPGVVLEAMSIGLPVVASDIGGLKELLDGGRAGWLAPAGDAEAWRRVIAGALRDDQRTSEQAARALVRVRQRHDPQVFIERIERIYESLVR
jgi:glycosyltransferase involved in cell wall biosynthesis